MASDYFQQTVDYFSRDRFATDAGARITEIGDHSAVCRMDLDDRHKNADGFVMGGVAFTLADFAFAVASNHQNLHSTVSLDATVHYLGQVRGNALIADARAVKEGKKTCLYHVTVTDDTGVPVADVTFTGYHVRIETDR